MAALVLETSGTQDYTVHPAQFITRVAESYGPAAAADIGTVISLTPPAPVRAALEAGLFSRCR
jgi:hypothetical protein